MTLSQLASSSTTDVDIGNSFEVHSHERLEQEHRRPLEENALFGAADDNTLWNNVTTLAPTSTPTTLPTQPTPSDPMTITLTIVLPFLLVMTVAMCSRSNPPGREYWRGAQIAANARRIREQRRIKSQRKALTPEERSLQIHTSMRCMYVVEKDARTGYLKLSEESKPLAETTKKTASSTSKSDIFQTKPDPEGQSPTDTDEDSESPTLSIDIRLIRSKGSHDTADTVPEDDLPSPPTSGNNEAAYIDNQDEENVCYICLDNFEVGDRVMWSRLHKKCDRDSCQIDANTSNHGCRHVFHQECIMPWLLEKRENECPSCRAPFLEDAPEPKQLTPEEEADAILALFERNTVEVQMGSDDVQHVAGNTSSHPVDIEAMVKSIDDDSDDDSDDAVDIEEGYSFVIDKGLIKTIPNFHGTLAVSVAFRRQSLTRPTTIATSNTADTAAESLEDDDHDNSGQDR
jgi:hypothetical protein